MENQIKDEEMNNPDLVFDNLTILKEFSNIANLVSTEEFLETVPKTKANTSKRVKWVPMFNFLKQGTLDGMIQEMNAMWKTENMPHRLEILEKQKEKFNDINQGLWRPQLGDVKAQLKASDAANLRKQKVLLESLAKEYESRVDRLKKTLSAKRGYAKALQMDIQKYQKKCEDLVPLINEKLENHGNIKKIIPSKSEIKEIDWSV